MQPRYFDASGTDAVDLLGNDDSRQSFIRCFNAWNSIILIGSIVEKLKRRKNDSKYTDIENVWEREKDERISGHWGSSNVAEVLQKVF